MPGLDRRERHKARVLETVEPDLVRGDDGYEVFWPMNNKGYLRSADLRVIADELDRRNEPWDRVVREGLGREGGA